MTHIAFENKYFVFASTSAISQTNPFSEQVKPVACWLAAATIYTACRIPKQPLSWCGSSGTMGSSRLCCPLGYIFSQLVFYAIIFILAATNVKAHAGFKRLEKRPEFSSKHQGGCLSHSCLTGQKQIKGTSSYCPILWKGAPSVFHKGTTKQVHIFLASATSGAHRHQALLPKYIIEITYFISIVPHWVVSAALQFSVRISFFCQIQLPSS